jgi:hypothetical protein
VPGTQPEPVSSCLSSDKRGMDRIMLEVVASGCVTTPRDIHKFVRCTLLSAEQACSAAAAAGEDTDSEGPRPDTVAMSCIESLKSLNAQGFIEWVKPEAGAAASAGFYRPLKLGLAGVAAGLQPDDALAMNEDVQTLVRAVNLESELHLMFLVAPVQPNDGLHWPHVAAVLREAYRRRAVVREVVQLSEVKLEQAEHWGRVQKKGWKPEVHRRAHADCCAAWCSTCASRLFASTLVRALQTCAPYLSCWFQVCESCMSCRLANTSTASA